MRNVVVLVDVVVVVVGVVGVDGGHAFVQDEIMLTSVPCSYSICTSEDVLLCNYDP